MGYLVKVDTNGSFPEKLKEMINLKLVDYVAMDIKGSRDRYTEIIGVNVDLEKIEESMKIVNDFLSGEFRTTIVGKYHDENSVREMGEWVNRVCEGNSKNLFLQGFRKGENGMIDKSFEKEDNVALKYLEKMKNVLEDFFDKVEVRG